MSRKQDRREFMRCACGAALGAAADESVNAAAQNG